MYLVLYEDGYCADACHGWEEFKTETDALAFISDRLRQSGKPSLSDYRLFHVKRECKLEAIERITEVQVQRG